MSDRLALAMLLLAIALCWPAMVPKDRPKPRISADP
jgi:hypothetical protein